MSNSTILLTRIDNRLIHGQVGITWTSALNANILVVVDDDVARDTLLQGLMKSVMNISTTKIYFFSREEAVVKLDEFSAKDRLFIVIKEPKTVRYLIDGNIKIDKLNLGNMHFSRGKLPLNRKVYCSKADYEDLLYLSIKGVSIFLQDVPGSIIEDFSKCKPLKF